MNVSPSLAMLLAPLTVNSWLTTTSATVAMDTQVSEQSFLNTLVVKINFFSTCTSTLYSLCLFRSSL